MIDIENITSQVKQNCNISDAQFWGTYSLCGLLLRLRELYRSEKGIRLWEKIPQGDVGEWIAEREAHWRELEEKDYGDIAINGDVFGPFEAGKINAELEKEGLVYGAGYGVHMKPSFFLAELVSRQQNGDYTIFISGREYARDLSEYPALLQDRTVFARTGPTRALLWQRFEELRCKGAKAELAFAFSRYGLFPQDEPSEEADMRISRIAASEVETYIRHELGEAFEGEKLGDEWKTLLACLPHSKAELFARAVKDILSDTSQKGMLKYIIDTRKEGSLGFYIVFLTGFRKIIFPEMFEAFRTFAATGDWQAVEDARNLGHKKAEVYAARLLSMYRNRKDDVSLPRSIEDQMLGGLL